jgi:hypothetical protein
VKLTTKKLKQMIREALSEVRNESMDHGERDEIRVASKEDGGWIITGTYKGRRVNIDSSYKRGGEASIRDWDNSPRYMMARELLYHFGGPHSEEGESFNIGKPDLDSTDIYIDGNPV